VFFSNNVPKQSVDYRSYTHSKAKSTGEQ